jgi:cytochrome c oxidase subunit 4
MSDQEHELDAHLQHSAGDGRGQANHGGLGMYLAVFVALCLLTGASFFTYSSYWPFDKHVAWAFMMAISCTKATLVVMFFMHLMWEANWKWVLTVPAILMSVFLVLMLVPDVAWRQNTGFAKYSDDRLLYAAERPTGPADKPQPPAETIHAHHDQPTTDSD